VTARVHRGVYGKGPINFVSSWKAANDGVMPVPLLRRRVFGVRASTTAKLSELDCASGTGTFNGYTITTSNVKTEGKNRAKITLRAHLGIVEI
jgi:hypothetical protein